MSRYSTTAKSKRYTFDSLKEVLAKASPERSGDCLAGVAAENDQERSEGDRSGEIGIPMGIAGVKNRFNLGWPHIVR